MQVELSCWLLVVGWFCGRGWSGEDGVDGFDTFIL